MIYVNYFNKLDQLHKQNCLKFKGGIILPVEVRTEKLSVVINPGTNDKGDFVHYLLPDNYQYQANGCEQGQDRYSVIHSRNSYDRRTCKQFCFC